MCRIKLLKAIVFFCQAHANAECKHLFEGRKMKQRWMDKLTSPLYLFQCHTVKVLSSSEGSEADITHNDQVFLQHLLFFVKDMKYRKKICIY